MAGPPTRSIPAPGQTRRDGKHHLIPSEQHHEDNVINGATKPLLANVLAMSTHCEN